MVVALVMQMGLKGVGVVLGEEWRRKELILERPLKTLRSVSFVIGQGEGEVQSTFFLLHSVHSMIILEISRGREGGREERSLLRREGGP